MSALKSTKTQRRIIADFARNLKDARTCSVLNDLDEHETRGIIWELAATLAPDASARGRDQRNELRNLAQGILDV